MSKIQVLSFEVANLIAAGEVVDRPASAIKEMMENAIDAGAKHITVEIQNGGVTLMRVTDDGCGMSAEDLPMAIRRHATSKIRDAADLDGIFTLGFRGEALAAIASVSDMRILSKRAEDPMGSMLEVRGGTLMGVTEQGSRNGTTVIVENLFANVPARRKFLKRDATEAMAVAANVERVALSHPEIAVLFLSDGVQKLRTEGDGRLQSTVWAVFGKDFATRLIPLDSEHEGIRVTGFVGRSDNVRANRGGQNFFINHRYVRSRTAQAALEQAFVSYLPPEKYPVCVMNLHLSPNRVDVNVHPAKLEVKFSNEKPIFEAVYYAVRQALENNVTRPEMTLGAPEKADKKSPLPTGGRVSDATVPVELERPESLRRRQVSMDMPTPAVPPAPHPPQTRMTAEDYVNYYVNRAAEKRGLPTEIHTDPADPPRPPLGHREDPADNAPNEPLSPIAAPSLPLIQDPSPDLTDPTPDAIPMSVYEAEAHALFGSPLAAPTPPALDTSAPVTPAPVPQEPPQEELHCTEGAFHCAEGAHHCGEAALASTPYRLVGEVFHAYLIVEVSDPAGDRMLLIDKHAAHERLIFEDLKAKMKDKTVESQLLLLPIEVMLMSEEVGLLDEYRPEIEAVGFSYTCLRNTVRVDSIPSGIDPAAIPDMINAIAAGLRAGVDGARLTRDIFFEKALYQAACKAAIKAGRIYPVEQEKWLVDRLMALPDITFCPHGRPIAMEMTKRTIDRQFERT